MLSSVRLVVVFS